MKPGVHKVAKFLASGASAAGVEYIAFLFFHRVGLPLAVSQVLSFCCGLIVSFTLNKNWVFTNKEEGSKQFATYVALAGINLLIGAGLIVLFVDGLNVPAPLSKVFVMGTIATWNFLIYERFIFIKTKEG